MQAVDGDAVVTKELDIQQSFFDFLKRRIRSVVVIVILCVLWTVSGISVLGREVFRNEVGFLFVMLPWLFVTWWLGGIQTKIRTLFWQQLAARYQWEYRAIKGVGQEKGMLFQVGRARTARNGMAGTYHELPFMVFEYEYAVGVGKHKHVVHFTVFEMQFAGTFPHIYLNYLKDEYTHTPSMFSSFSNIPVPTEFGERFSLYAPQKYEVEALEIFTTDIFLLLLDASWDHDLELVDGELIIYSPMRFNSQSEFEQELLKVKTCIDILLPRLNRAQLTPIGDQSPLLER